MTKPQCSWERPRSGFTMLEILIVLSVLVVLAAITWPAIGRYLPEQELREGADAVRHHLSLTRLHAIETGMPYQFRYEPNGRKYIVLPYELPKLGKQENSREAAAPVTATGAKLASESEELPKGLRFHAEAGEPAEILPNEWLSLLPDSTGLRQISWSKPILFQPTGTSDDTSVKLVNKKEFHLSVYARGLTGGVTVGKVKEP